MKSTYQIAILDPAPAMTQTKTEFVGTYREAVAAAHQAWIDGGRAVTVYSGLIYRLHSVDYLGNARDFNTNSGVPTHQKLERPSGPRAIGINSREFAERLGLRCECGAPADGNGALCQACYDEAGEEIAAQEAGR